MGLSGAASGHISSPNLLYVIYICIVTTEKEKIVVDSIINRYFFFLMFLFVC